MISKHLIKILKGSLIGTGLILPGISGAMIATLLYIYKDLIEALNLLLKKPFQAIKSIWEYIIGIFIGLGISVLFIQNFLEHLLIPITFLFIGFILGGIPLMIKQVNLKRLNWKHVLTFICASVIMISFLFISENQTEIGSGLYYFVLILIGVLTSISMIIPGLSGATILMALGVYHILILETSNMIKALLSFDLGKAFSQLPFILLIAIGVIIGLIAIGKLVYYLIKEKPSYFNIAVLAVVVMSPINILIMLNRTVDTGLLQVKITTWIISLIGLFIGAVLVLFLVKKAKENKQEVSR